MNIVVFEDPQVDNLYPITPGRAAYAITCASYRLIDWLLLLDAPIKGVVRSHLRTLQLLDFPNFIQKLSPEHNLTLLVNARVVPHVGMFEHLQSMLKSTKTGVARSGSAITAAVVNTADLIDREDLAILQAIDQLCHQPQAPNWIDYEFELFNFPHDVVRCNMEYLEANLRHRIDSGAYREIQDNVFAAKDAKLGEYGVTITTDGPIVLERNAQIGPYCFVSGPAYVGTGARVIEHSAIKDAVTLAHTTKIGGEIESSVIEPYTNKQHHGFLGHSYLGSWINLGAGTCNSDLKNTYGKVKMEYRGEKVDTNMQFIGCIMGDYAKTAINTGIFTGKVIGTCSMVYGFVTTNVPSFVNYARSFGQVTEMPPSVMESTQQRMFMRRNVTQRPSDLQLLHDMYHLTQHERQLAGEPLVL